jgi:hypothetical protein
MDDKTRARIRSSRQHIDHGIELSNRTRRTIEITREIIARSAPLDINCDLCGRGLRAGDDRVRHDETLALAACREGRARFGSPAA